MTHTIRTVVVYLVRFAILWFVDALSLLATSWVMPGLTLTAVNGASLLTVAIGAAFTLAIVNLLIRPIVFLIARPLGWVAMFVIGFLVNAVAIWITAYLMPGFEVTILAAIAGRHRLCLLQRRPDRYPGHRRGGLLVPEPHREARQGAAVRQRRRARPRADDAGDRRAELLAHQEGDRRWADAHAGADDRGGWLRAVARRLRPAVDDLFLPGRHHVWRQLRYSCLSLVRQGEEEAVRIGERRHRAERALRARARG